MMAISWPCPTAMEVHSLRCFALGNLVPRSHVHVVSDFCTVGAQTSTEHPITCVFHVTDMFGAGGGASHPYILSLALYFNYVPIFLSSIVIKFRVYILCYKALGQGFKKLTIVKC
jgi:hypothetical protein